MESKDLHLLETFPNGATAEIARSLLEDRGIEAFVEPGDPLTRPLAGVMKGVRLFVLPHEAFRARSVLEDSAFSDAELVYLATGESETEE